MNTNTQLRQEMSPARPKNQAVEEAATGRAEEMYVGNGPQVAKSIGEVRVGGRTPADGTGSVGLVGSTEGNGEVATSETVCTLLEPSTKPSILTAELR